jgi:hypothetical protein
MGLSSHPVGRAVRVAAPRWEEADVSGPIVRKYGFPNFEKIFGEKPILHGKDEQPEKPTERGKAPVNEKEQEPGAKTE